MTGALVLLRTALALGAGLLVTTFAYEIAKTPARPRALLGIRGWKRQRALSTSFAAIEPLIRWLGTRIVTILPERIAAFVDRQLVLSGHHLGLLPEEYVAMVLGSATGGVLFGVAYATASGAVLPAIFFALSLALTPWMIISRVTVRRARAITRGLPYVLDVVALCLSAGLDFPGAVRQVVSRSSDPEDALTEELEYILHELAIGRTRRAALEGFAERAGLASVTEVVAAILQSEARGNPLADTLAIQARVSRERRSARAEQGAARSATMIYLPLGLAMASVLLLVGGPLFMQMQAVMGR